VQIVVKKYLEWAIEQWHELFAQAFLVNYF